MTIAGLNDAAVALLSTIGRACRRRRPSHRIASLDRRVLRDIGYTRHGIREAALAIRNEARP